MDVPTNDTTTTRGRTNRNYERFNNIEDLVQNLNDDNATNNDAIETQQAVEAEENEGELFNNIIQIHNRIRQANSMKNRNLESYQRMLHMFYMKPQRK